MPQAASPRQALPPNTARRPCPFKNLLEENVKRKKKKKKAKSKINKRPHPDFSPETLIKAL